MLGEGVYIMSNVHYVDVLHRSALARAATCAARSLPTGIGSTAIVEITACKPIAKSLVGRRPAPLSVWTAHFPAEILGAAVRRILNARAGLIGSTFEQPGAGHGVVATERMLRAGADVVFGDAVR